MPLGDTPYVFRGGQEDLRRLFYSDPDKAMCKAITIPGGYGVIPGGAVMGLISESTNRVGYYLPYSPFDAVGAIAAAMENGFGLAFTVNDPSTGTSVNVTLADSYKFAVGDHLVIADSDLSPTDLGAITAIDRTTYTHMAVITVTNACGSETMAKGAAVSIQTTTSTPYVKAVGVLKSGVDTGVGENAKGGQGVLVIKNAMLYVNSVYNYNADVLTDLSWATADDQYLIM